jgi:hypothetical protein
MVYGGDDSTSRSRVQLTIDYPDTLRRFLPANFAPRHLISNAAHFFNAQHSTFSKLPAARSRGQNDWPDGIHWMSSSDLFLAGMRC